MKPVEQPTTVFGFCRALRCKRYDPGGDSNDEGDEKDGVTKDITGVKAVLKHGFVFGVCGLSKRAAAV